MSILTDEVKHFFQRQGYVVVSTFGRDENIHSSCKGIVSISQEDEIYLLDLYSGETQKNLKKNKKISVVGIDEHKFVGYCLKGKAEIVDNEEVSPEIVNVWKNKIASRVTNRILKQIKGEKGHPKHPEILMPHPKYMIVMKVEEVVDLTPAHLK